MAGQAGSRTLAHAPSARYELLRVTSAAIVLGYPCRRESRLPLTAPASRMPSG
jgi:hypothetical protein